MNKEIEMKARVADPAGLKNKLTSLYGKGSEIHKTDIYYLYKTDSADGRGQPVRLRSENGRHTVTLKRKTQSGGIEVNDELEFTVDDAGSFLDYLQMTGAVEWITKKKNGWKFTADDDGDIIVIELCEVSSLGWFIEIEIVIDSSDENRIAAARLKIRNILDSAEVPEDEIEPRYYSDLLLEKKDPPDSTNRTGKEVD